MPVQPKEPHRPNVTDSATPARMCRDERRVHRFEISQEGFEGLRIGREGRPQPGRGGWNFPELAEFIEGGHWVAVFF